MLFINCFSFFQFQNTSKEKGHNADKARDEYTVALENFNKTQTLFYDAEMPKIVDVSTFLPIVSRFICICYSLFVDKQRLSLF